MHKGSNERIKQNCDILPLKEKLNTVRENINSYRVGMYIKPNNDKICFKHCMKQDNFTCKRLKSGFYEKVTYNCEQLLCHQVFTSLASLPDMSWSHLNKYLFFVKVVNYIKCY